MIATRLAFIALALAFPTLSHAVFIARTTHGNFQIVGKGANVQLLPPQGPMGNGNAIASTGTITQGMGATAAGSTAAAGINLTGNAKIPVNGTNVPVQVKTNIGTDVLIPAAIAAATCAKGGAVGAIVCAGGVVVAPIALNWLANAGARINDQTKQLEMQVDASTYRWNCALLPANFVATTASAAEQCAASWQADWRSRGYPLCSVTGIVVQAGRFRSTSTNCGGGGAFAGIAGTLVSTANNWIPASMDDIAPYMRNVAVDPGIVNEVTNAGQDLGNPPLNVTGPAQIVGPTQTTINNTTNTTTTSTTTNNYTYNNNTITNTSSVTQRQTTNANGETVESTTTTTPTDPNAAEPEQSEQEAVPTDTALPPVPTLYERKYPNGMEGIWNDYSEQLKGTDLVSLVGKLMPTVGDGGTCPTWPINLDFSQWAAYGTHDVAPPCWIWDVAKAILILSALLLARALIFGG